MVNVDLPWWQWHLNGSHLFPMLCCDLCKEIKMAAFLICIVTVAFTWGQNSYLGCDAFLGVSLFLPHWAPHLSCG